VAHRPKRATGRKAISFALIGLVNNALDFAIFSLAYYHLELSIVSANIISWVLTATGSYIMNSLTTFARESGRKLRARAYFRFLIALFAGFLANTATVIVASYFMPVLVAKVLAIGASFLVNFSLSHFVVFPSRSTENSRPRPPSGGN
jgi:putative flippase GtrA